MALLQGTKKLFGPLLCDLNCIRAVKEAMELQVEACMKEEDEVAVATITQAPSARARTSLRRRDVRVYKRQPTSRNNFL